MYMNKLQLILFLLCILIINSNSQFQQTFCRHGINLLIFDNSTVRDSILINTGLNNVLDVNVRIDTLLHTWVNDLAIDLKKNNTTVRLFNHTGSSGDNFINTVLNDSGLIIIDSAAAPFTGVFRPNQPLSVFNNQASNGYWVLSISDNSNGDTGMLNKWCLVIKIGFIDGIIENIEIPNTYRLYQNYPNPFNPSTKIRYGLPKKSFVKLSVINTLGQEVAVLVNGEKSANTYEAVFDAANLPSGVYYYKLEADGFSVTKKMVIIK